MPRLPPTTKQPDNPQQAIEDLKPPKEPPTATPDRCKDPCVQSLSDKADEAAKKTEIKVKLFKSCSKPGADGTATNEIDFEEKSIKVPAAEADGYKLLYDRIFAIESAQCDAVAVASVPEWWAVRVGADRPQLAILFAEVFSTGKLGNSRWTMHIPHYDKPKGFKPSIPSYTKGHWRGTLTLKDNSKLIINANSKTEAQKMINKLKILIPVALRSEANGKAIKPQITEDSDNKFKEVKVVPVRADYYGKGRLNGVPDWSINFRKK